MFRTIGRMSPRKCEDNPGWNAETIVRKTGDPSPRLAKPEETASRFGMFCGGAVVRERSHREAGHRRPDLQQSFSRLLDAGDRLPASAPARTADDLCRVGSGPRMQRIHVFPVRVAKSLVESGSSAKRSRDFGRDLFPLLRSGGSVDRNAVRRRGWSGAR